MKSKQKLFIAFLTGFICLHLQAYIVFAQSPSGPQDTTEISWCSFSPAENYQIIGPGFNPRVTSWGGFELPCGKITLFFTDVDLGSGEGFDEDEDNLGEIRRNCACTTMLYIQDVIDFSMVSETEPLGIRFLESTDLDGDALGKGSSNIESDVLIAPGFYTGFVYDYIQGGNNNGVIEHGNITMDFEDYQYRYCSGDFNEDCDYDFRSVILHEFTHTMGVGSQLAYDASTGDLTTYTSTGWDEEAFMLYDSAFLYYSDGSTFEKLVDVNTIEINPSLSSTSYMDHQDNIWLNNSSFTSRDNQPIYSSGAYTFGSSLQHFDQDFYSRANYSPAFSPNYNMNWSIGQSVLKSTYTKEDLKMLEALGYTINTSEVPHFNNTPPTAIPPTASGAAIIDNEYHDFAEHPCPASNCSLQIQTLNDCTPVVIDLTTDNAD